MTREQDIQEPFARHSCASCWGPCFAQQVQVSNEGMHCEGINLCNLVCWLLQHSHMSKSVASMTSAANQVAFAYALLYSEIRARLT